MHLYRGSIELLDYVFYATVERGKVYEIGAFIHNYALAYALGLARGETYTYTRLTQKPHYEEELTPLNGRLYLTPAAPQSVVNRLMQWNTLREGYAYPGKPQSIGYPDWGFARIFRPGSRFTFYLFLADLSAPPDAPALRDLLAGQTARVRLGKFPAKARLQLEPANQVIEKSGSFLANTFLNWRDLETDPQVCDVVATGLPTRLLARAQFADEPYYEAYFGPDVVRLPVRMRFLARPLAEKRRGRG